MRRSHVDWIVLLVVALAASVLLQRLWAGTLTSAAPRGISSLLPLHITGTGSGFDRKASSNVVSFLQGGVVVATARGKSLVDTLKSNGLRTVTVDVPAGIPLGTTALRVLNEVTREVSEGASVEIIGISLPEIVSAPRGSQVSVRIQGSPNVQFLSGGTTVTFGQGITTKTVTVLSPTSLVATIAIDRRATAGLRSVMTETTSQSALIEGAFTVTTGGSANRAPIANAGGPYAGVATQAVRFDGTRSSDPDGDPLTFAWDFGDGQQGSGPTPSHAYAQPGQFTVSLTVSDGRGATASATTTASISPPANQSPVSRPGGPYSGTAGQPVNFDGSTSSDPDGDTLTFAWQFGDGTSGSGATPTHTYASAGNFTVTLTVNDGRGGSNSATTTAAIVPAPPLNQPPVSRPGGPYSGTAGQPVNFDGSTSSDPDGDTLTFAWQFGDGSSGTGVKPTHTYAAAGEYPVELTVSDGRGGSNTANTTARITNPSPVNRPPSITSSPLLTATALQPYAYQVTATDPDGDPLTFSLSQPPAGMTVSNAGLVAWTPTIAQVGPNPVTVSVSDGRGGSDTQTYSIQVAPPPATLTSIEVAPSSVYFSTLGTTRALTITGRLSDQTTTDLTSAASGTTYESTNPFVARVSADGVVTSSGNGDATITARNSTFTAIVGVVVESGVTLDSLELTPSSATLHSPGAVLSLTLNGHFSDQTVRDLTAATGTVFQSSDDRIARVDAQGKVTAIANGQATIQATYDARTATASVTVAISGGRGFFTGEVYDDSRSQPLAGASVTLIADGGGPLDPPLQTIADDRGRFVISGQSGDAIVRIAKPGFTSVDRVARLPLDGSTTLLDARLTPLDSHPSPVVSVFGGEVHDAASTVRLQVPPGALEADSSITLTALSAQGLAGRLPLGWSPIAAVDIQPAGLRFFSAATLRLPNVASLAAGADVVAATYDLSRRAWVGHTPAHVTADGQAIEVAIAGSGQVVAVIPDGDPFVPPSPVPGEPLAGVSVQDLPSDVSASGDVLPRSAPPGDGVRAVGRIGLNTLAVPSGTPVHVHVTEQFDLLDTARVVPLPFTQDVLVHARPRPPNGNPLGATFAITPSRAYTIQELLLGVVKLRVATPTEASAASIVGSTGGIVTAADGDILTIPANALATDALVGLRRITVDQIATPVPLGFDLLGALDVDLVGTRLVQPGELSIPRPNGLADDAQILVVQVFRDPIGVAHLRVIGTGRVDTARIVSQTTVGTLTFEGVVSGGSYLFLRAQQPVGFVTGRIVGGDGLTPQALALVTAEASAFADLTSTTGGYAVAALTSPAVAVHVLDTISRNAAAGSVNLPARDAVAVLNLGLAIVAPLVTSTSPAANATNVPLDSSIAVDFSEAIDPVSITEANVKLQIGDAPVTALRTLSADGRHLTIRPQQPLQGKSTVTLALTSGIRDLAGNGLLPFAPLSFTTLDPTKPPQPPPGQITAELPDEDGLVLVFATGGTAVGGSPVSAANLRTQETITVLALADGSFRFRLTAIVGDPITITFRDPSGRDTSYSIQQFQSAEGTSGIGDLGGTIDGSSGRVGRVLPRALTAPGLFSLTDPVAGTAPPALPNGLEYADRFVFSMSGATFNRLAALTLSESQNRFAAQTALTAPFTTGGELIVPSDFLTNASLRFTATARDAAGNRQSVSGATLVVASMPDTGMSEAAAAALFPSVYLSAPAQAVTNQQVHVQALAPAARVNLDLPAPSTTATATFLLARAIDVGGQPRWSVLDRLALEGAGAAERLRTTGREFPGMTASGDYAVIASSEPLAFLSGRVNGPAAIVESDELPFVFETGAPNGSFIIPVRPGQPFTLRFVAADGGSILGTATGTAPAAGTVDLGSPLAATGGVLTVTADPSDTSIVDINATLILRFSEAIDPNTASSGIVVTDASGIRVFGTIATSADGRTVTFTPQRRWRYGTTYRWGIAQTIVGLTGARFSAPAAGQFTTFAPVVLGAAAVGTAKGIAATTALAITTTSTGFAVLDTSSPSHPQTVAQQAVDGGANAVALLSNATLIDRNGQTIQGTFAIVSSGNTETAGRLLTFDVTTPTAPRLIGSTQLTTAPGVPAPPGVPDVAGVPVDVALTPDNHALVAVTGAGLFKVGIGQTIPVDGANAGRGIDASYPAGTAGSAFGSAVLGTRVVTIGSDGLAVLDVSTLQRNAGVAISGTTRAVAAIPAFAMDLNGDGVTGSGEVFDLAVVAGGTDGTVQFYRIPATGDPVLISVVRLPDAAAGVALDSTERLTYVSGGARGLVIVDLDGPASIQPIDADHDGTDDRILDVLDTPGAAERTAPVLHRGLGLVADGAAGAATVQLLPPRTRFLTLARDPIAGHSGDEQSILDTRVAFVSDDALALGLDVQDSGNSQLFLVIEEQPENGGPSVVTFEDQTKSKRLASGLNQVMMAIAPGSSGATVALQVQDEGGHAIARLELRLGVVDLSETAVRRIFVVPAEGTIGAASSTLQLKVGGVDANNRTLNLTAGASGTTYGSENERVAAVSADGLVTPVAGGFASIGAQNGDQFAFAAITIDRPPSLVALQADRSVLTLRVSGSVPLPVTGVMSDESVLTLGELTATVFTSSDPSIVTVSAAGEITPIANGLATVTVTNGSIATTVQVAVDLRSPAAVTAIDLSPFPDAPSLDAGPISLIAHLTGTGSLDGLTVTFALSGPAPAQLQATTVFDGTAGVRASTLAAGTYSVTASVIDPATGQSRSDTETLVLTASTGDNEPNGDLSAASPLTEGRTATGTVTAGTDTRDDYQLQSASDGVVTVSLHLADGSSPSSVDIVIRSATGEILQRISPTNADTELTLSLPAAGAYVSIEAKAGTAAYQLSTRFDQADITITGVAPLAGPPGTTVTIDGTGFSTALSDNSVLFGGIGGRVISATRTRLQAIVPALGVTGPIEVISGSSQVTGPVFNTGTAGPAPAATVRDALPDSTREDPVSGVVVNITRLKVYVDPGMTRAQVAALAQPLGGDIAGHIPSINTYILEFPANRTFDGLRALQTQLASQPGVLEVARSLIYDFDSAIDQRDFAPHWPGLRARLGAVWQRIKLFDAFDGIRTTPPFHNAANFHRVKVAIIDDGFSPNVPAEFKRPDGTSLITVRKRIDGVWTDIQPQAFGNHGTAIATVVGATNDGSSVNGVLNGVMRPGELPFDVVMYINNDTSGKIQDSLVTTALDHIRQAGDIDAVNLSFGHNCGGDADCVARDVNDYRRVIKNMVGRTMVLISAGNNGVVADTNVPSALALEAEPPRCGGGAPCLANVLSIGASAVVNVDRTGEGADHRAVFPKLRSSLPGNTICKPSTAKSGSNCTPGVTLVAPGEDHYVVGVGGVNNYHYFNGTSSAAPTVAGVAALLQSIRETPQIIRPDRLREILVSTADDITNIDSTWDPTHSGQTIGRVNVLAAVRAVLPADAGQRIYVADGALSANGAGHLVGLEIDPLTGSLVSTTADAVVDLVLEGHRFHHPSAIALAPTGDRAYVVAKGPPDVGDALLFINTRNLQVEGGVLIPVAITVTRPSLAVSKDGRLVYMATGAGFAIINTVAPKVVENFDDLPSPYNTQADNFGISELETRLNTVATNAREAVGASFPMAFTDVTLSADGRTLFLTVQTGVGTDYQPGVLVPLNVDLYHDADPDTADVEPDLTNYLRQAFSGTKAMAMTDPGTVDGGDEPSDAAVSPDGKFLYLANGGMAGIAYKPGPELGPNTNPTNPKSFNDLGLAATSGLSVAPELANVIRADIDLIVAQGANLMSAIGNTGVFSLNPQSPWQVGKFPSEIVYGWAPSPFNGGRVVNQVRFRSVYAKRPFGIAMRPDGNRAFVSFFQTGNFGVLDLEHQSLFPYSPNDTFGGLVAVTQALRFDNFLWPSRGAYTSPDTTFVPSPDERLMFPTGIEYAQNGRFAAAVHTGVHPPGDVTALLPDFLYDTQARLSLEQIGFQVDLETGDATDPAGLSVGSFEPYTFDRGGGAITILKDDAISRDLMANASRTITGTNGDLRPYYAEFPVCGIPDAQFAKCIVDPFTQVFEYHTSPGTAVKFDRPRAVGIQPFVYVESPRNGDAIFKGTRVRVGWRDPRISKLRVRVTDLGVPGTTAPPVQLDTFNATLTSPERNRHSVTRKFQSFFVGDVPVSGHRYELEIAMQNDAGDTLSITELEVQLK